MANFIELKPKNVDTAAWGIVIEAWENGLSDREAAFRVSKITGKMLKASDIQTWYKDNPEIAELRANLMNELLASAKLTIAETLRDPDNRERIKTARWYAERKGADEFSTKQAVAFEGAVIELSLEEKEKKLQELVDKFDGE